MTLSQILTRARARSRSRRKPVVGFQDKIILLHANWSAMYPRAPGIIRVARKPIHRSPQPPGGYMCGKPRAAGCFNCGTYKPRVKIYNHSSCARSLYKWRGRTRLGSTSGHGKAHSFVRFYSRYRSPIVNPRDVCQRNIRVCTTFSPSRR